MWKFENVEMWKCGNGKMGKWENGKMSGKSRRVGEGARGDFHNWSFQIHQTNKHKTICFTFV